MKTTTKNAKEIAEQLDCGMRAYCHKKTGELVFVPNETELYGIDLEAWDEDLELLDNNYTDYHEIEKWTSGEAFQMMADFAEELTGNTQLQNKLIDALNRSKPFRNFKFIIDNSGDYRQQWFTFKNQWQQAFVERQLISLNNLEA